MFLNDDIDKYFSIDKWNSLSLLKKEIIIIRLYKRAKKEITNNCNKIQIKSLPNLNIQGFFNIDSKNIYVNLNNLIKSDDGYSFYNLIYHELYHSHQNLLVEQEEALFLNKILQQNNPTYLNNKIAYFYINDFMNLSIKSKEIALCYYRLCSLEREAITYSYNKTLNITNTYADLISKTISNFNDIYNISLSDKEIFTLIDTCYLNIYDHIKPANDLEATIMYDICILALYQGKSLNEKEVSKYLNKETKQEILETQGYNIYNPNFIPNNSFSKKYDITILSMNEINDIINNMNKAQIKNNPTFLYKAKKLLQDQKTAKKNCNNNIIDINITHNDDYNYELE